MRASPWRLAAACVLLAALAPRGPLRAASAQEEEDEEATDTFDEVKPRREPEGEEPDRGTWDDYAGSRAPRRTSRRSARRSAGDETGEEDPMGDVGGRARGRRRLRIPADSGAPTPLKSMSSSRSWKYCGGAPDSLIPFRKSDYIHASQKLPKASSSSRRLLADGPGGGGEIWGGDRDHAVHEDGGAEEEEEGVGGDAGEGGNCTGVERIDGSTEHGRKLLRLGYTLKRVGCNMNRNAKVLHENEGSGPSQGKAVQPEEGPLVKCLQGIKSCGTEAQRLARALPSAKKFATQAKVRLGGARSYRTCALVGNAGHVVKKSYGSYINKHDVVVRFNVLDVKKYSKNVGSKTTFRVMNNARSVDACCSNKMPEKRGIGMVFWFPANRPEMKRRCKSRYPGNNQYWLSRSFILKEVATMNAMRKDLKRLGFSGFKSWRQLTSGGHAVLLFSKLCDYVSLYGFTTYSSKGPDQYGGRGQKTVSGQIWHDWKGEQLAWRLLHAQGNLQICSL